MEEMKQGNETNLNEKKRTSRQMKLSIVMVVVSLIVLSVSTYAWFLITNTPKVKEIALTADTLGDLKIADVTTDGNGAETIGAYGDEVDLKNRSMGNLYLSPVTTADGKNFFKPKYIEGKVDSVEKVSDPTVLHKKYVYEKVFYLRAGEEGNISGLTDDNKKIYDIFLVGKPLEESNDNGCYIKQSNLLTKDKTAANAVRVSLEFEHGVNENDGTSLENSTIVIYEPNCENDNDGILGTNSAYMNDSVNINYGVNKYTTVKQKSDKTFDTTSNSGVDARSKAIYTIREGDEIRVTMRIWLEGTDKDCMNAIAADQIVGQIQFISEENLTQFGNGASGSGENQEQNP